MLSGQTTTRTTAPAPPPYDLNARLSPLTVAMYAGMLLGGALVTALGAWLFSVGTAEPVAYRTAGGWIWFILGVCLALAGGAMFLVALWHLLSLARYEVEARRLWTEQIIWERQQNHGVVVHEVETEWTLRATDPRHVLLVALAVYWQAKRGETTPWSVRNLRRVEVYDGAGMSLLGETTEEQARAFGDALAQMGVVRGRREKSAGQLAVADADELLDKVMPALRRVS